MKTKFIGISQLITPSQTKKKMEMLIEDGVILEIGTHVSEASKTIDLEGRGVMPALVDCHTHLVFGGNRLGEYKLRAKGASYEEILESGGGIYNTVLGTSEASENHLFRHAMTRLDRAVKNGIGTVEIKSGYGLEPENELKMLRVIRRLKESHNIKIIPTLLAHVIPKGWEKEGYIKVFCEELMPKVKAEGLADAVDVFCDRGAFDINDTRIILSKAKELGFKVKAHAEQLTHTGASLLIGELGGLSADHLEQTTKEDWKQMAQSGVVGTLLPGAAFILKKPFPDARAMWDQGVQLAIATDLNPGSSPMPSLFLALQMGMILGNLSVEEVVCAGTQNAAKALGLQRVGRLEAGYIADFLVIDHPDPYHALYMWGDPNIHQVYLNGQAQ